MANKHMKNAYHYYSLGKCKAKPQWDTMSHLLGWPSSKRQELRCIGQDMEEKRTPVGVQTGAAGMENSMEVPKKI